jgi:hypothetical protein
MPEARTEPRKPFMCRISVVWEDQTGSPRTQTGLLEDWSTSGVGITVNGPIPVGTSVKIRGRRRELVGSVRHCRREERDYFVGIRLEGVDVAWANFGAGL